jgi:uncharacterized protein YjbI with pentapeptide repeats
MRKRDGYRVLYLTGINLERAELKGINLKSTILENANLRFVNISGALFYDTSLQRANLSQSNLIGVTMVNTNLQNADLSHASLIGANIDNTNLQNADLSYASLIGVDFGETTTFIGTNLQYASILGSHFNGITTFIGTNLEHASILGSHFGGMVNFIGQDLTYASISGLRESTAMLNLIYSQTVNVSFYVYEQHLTNEYIESLSAFSSTINEQLKGLNVPSKQLAELQEAISSLGQEVNSLKYVQYNNIAYVKKVTIESKITYVIQKTLKIFPGAAEAHAIFAPLASFSKIIGKSIQSIVEAIIKIQENRAEDGSTQGPDGLIYASQVVR